MNNATRAAFEELRSLTSASISQVFAVIGSSLINPARLIKISNNTDTDLVISFDGITDHDFVPSNSFTLYDFSANLSINPGQLTLPANTLVYARDLGTPAISGSVYLTVIYGTTH